MDASTQIMACGSELVGNVAIDAEHRNHEAMHNTIVDCSISLPATFEQYAPRGIEGTYHTSNGMVRLDYVGIMGGCTAVPGSAVTWPNFDMMTDNDDHRPTALKVLMPAKAISSPENDEYLAMTAATLRM